MLRNYFENLRVHIADNPSDFGDSDSVLTLLYEAYSEIYNLDDAQTKADLHALYESMNEMTLQDMDRVIDPVCRLCRDHERSGFVNGVRVGICMERELTEK